MIYLGKKLKTFVTFDFVNIRSSRRYFAYRGPGTSFIRKDIRLLDLLSTFIDGSVLTFGDGMFSSPFKL